MQRRFQRGLIECRDRMNAGITVQVFRMTTRPLHECLKLHFVFHHTTAEATCTSVYVHQYRCTLHVDFRENKYSVDFIYFFLPIIFFTWIFRCEKTSTHHSSLNTLLLSLVYFYIAYSTVTLVLHLFFYRALFCFLAFIPFFLFIYSEALTLYLLVKLYYIFCLRSHIT